MKTYLIYLKHPYIYIQAFCEKTDCIPIIASLYKNISPRIFPKKFIFVNGGAINWILFQKPFSVTKLHLQEMVSTIFTTTMCGQSKTFMLFEKPIWNN